MGEEKKVFLMMVSEEESLFFRLSTKLGPNYLCFHPSLRDEKKEKKRSKKRQKNGECPAHFAKKKGEKTQVAAFLLQAPSEFLIRFPLCSPPPASLSFPSPFRVVITS